MKTEKRTENKHVNVKRNQIPLRNLKKQHHHQNKTTSIYEKKKEKMKKHKLKKKQIKSSAQFKLLFFAKLKVFCF